MSRAQTTTSWKEGEDEVCVGVGEGWGVDIIHQGPREAGGNKKMMEETLNAKQSQKGKVQDGGKEKRE